MDIYGLVDAAITPILIGVGGLVCIGLLWFAHRHPVPVARSAFRWVAVIAFANVLLGVERLVQSGSGALARALSWTAVILMWIGIFKIYRMIKTGALVLGK